MAISSTVNPIDCMWIVRYGSNDDVAEKYQRKKKKIVLNIE